MNMHGGNLSSEVTEDEEDKSVNGDPSKAVFETSSTAPVSIFYYQ